MALKVSVTPRILRWARERAALDRAELALKMGLKPTRVDNWEATGELSLDHLRRLADKTHTAIGYLFLTEPPTELLPVADFRTHAGEGRDHASPELLDTLYQCQTRQEWYRDYVRSQGEDRLPFIGSARPDETATQLAQRIRQELGLDTVGRAKLGSWEDALGDLLEKVERLGVLVMRNGVVGNNTRRKLDVSEFRGFALSDDFAPLVFINGADSTAAQMFTLAHELGHLWRGESGISDANPETSIASERFSNRVAAEVLVPMAEFRAQWQKDVDPELQAGQLARYFKVSILTLLIRAREANEINAALFRRLYDAESARVRRRKGRGGDFYRTQKSRLGNRFAAAVVSSAFEGDTTYKEAYRLLGIRKAATFDELARVLGVRA